ncbi:LysR substrate-binding domain-containing protein [Rhodococcus jostii]|jgi:DNA-binding transcriptional LysR family regulator|uniref:LysR substrate-binding domain-containing protein n=1 Tax=Rhodococcus jostii TaxID=132919 RepID=UPI003982615D
MEIAIGYNAHLDRALKTAALYDTRMHVILSVSHPLAQQASVSIEELVDEPLILLDTHPGPSPRSTISFGTAPSLVDI